MVDRRHTARTGHARKRAAPHTDSVQKQALDKAHKKRARVVRAACRFVVLSMPNHAV